MLKTPLRVAKRGESRGYLKVSGDYRVMESDGNILAPCLAEAKAQEIVSACNNHDKLKHLHDTAWWFLIRWDTEMENMPQEVLDWIDDALAYVLIELRQAVAQVKGEGSDTTQSS